MVRIVYIAHNNGQAKCIYRVLDTFIALGYDQKFVEKSLLGQCIHIKDLILSLLYKYMNSDKHLCTSVFI